MALGLGTPPIALPLPLPLDLDQVRPERRVLGVKLTGIHGQLDRLVLRLREGLAKLGVFEGHGQKLGALLMHPAGEVSRMVNIVIKSNNEKISERESRIVIRYI